MKVIDKYFKNNSKLKNKKKIVFIFSGISIFILLWLFLGNLVLSRPEFTDFNGFLFLPSLKALIQLLFSSKFWFSVLISMFRIISGLIIAILIGIPFGLLNGFYKNLRDLTYIPIQFLRMISPLSWMPIAIIMFPLLDYSIIFLIMISSIWSIILNTQEGVININPEWIKMARNQGAKDLQLFFKVIFPASIPYVFSGIRMAVGIAWIVLVPAEFLSTSGLGYLINNAKDDIAYDRLMSIIIAIGLLGFIIDGIFQLIQRRIDWRMK